MRWAAGYLRRKFFSGHQEEEMGSHQEWKTEYESNWILLETLLNQKLAAEQETQSTSCSSSFYRTLLLFLRCLYECFKGDIKETLFNKMADDLLELFSSQSSELDEKSEELQNKSSYFATKIYAILKKYKHHFLLLDQTEIIENWDRLVQAIEPRLRQEQKQARGERWRDLVGQVIRTFVVFSLSNDNIPQDWQRQEQLVRRLDLLYEIFESIIDEHDKAEEVLINLIGRLGQLVENTFDPMKIGVFAIKADSTLEFLKHHYFMLSRHDQAIKEKYLTQIKEVIDQASELYPPAYLNEEAKEETSLLDEEYKEEQASSRALVRSEFCHSSSSTPLLDQSFSSFRTYLLRVITDVIEEINTDLSLDISVKLRSLLSDLFESLSATFTAEEAYVIYQAKKKAILRAFHPDKHVQESEERQAAYTEMSKKVISLFEKLNKHWVEHLKSKKLINQIREELREFKREMKEDFAENIAFIREIQSENEAFLEKIERDNLALEKLSKKMTRERKKTSVLLEAVTKNNQELDRIERKITNLIEILDTGITILGDSYQTEEKREFLPTFFLWERVLVQLLQGRELTSPITLHVGQLPNSLTTTPNEHESEEDDQDRYLTLK